MMKAQQRTTVWVAGMTLVMFTGTQATLAVDDKSDLRVELDNAMAHLQQIERSIDQINDSIAQLESRITWLHRAMKVAQSTREYWALVDEMRTAQSELRDLQPNLRRYVRTQAQAAREVKRIQRILEECPTC